MKSTKAATIAEGAVTKSITQRVASNFGWSIVSEAIGKGVFFITNIYLARTLGVENFGLFTLAQTITFYFWLAVDLGTNMYGIREIAKDKENSEETINPLLTLRITAGFIVFSLYVISLFILGMPAIKRLTFAGCGLYLLTYAFYSDWVLKGIEKFKYIAFGSFVSSIAFLVGTIYLVRTNNDVTIASFIWSSSYLLGSISLLYFLYRKLGIKYRPSFNFKIWVSHIKESIYFTISGSLMVIYQYLPILLLSIFFTNYEVGIFSAPYRIIITVCSAGFLLPMAFYPVFSELYEKDKVRFLRNQKIFRRFMIAVGLIVATLGIIFSEKVIILLFGTQYISSVPVFQIILLLVPLYFLRYTYGTLLLATGYQRHHNIATFSGLAGMVFNGLLLIPWKGLFGAAMALLAAEVIMVSSMFLLADLTFKRR